MTKYKDRQVKANHLIETFEIVSIYANLKGELPREHRRKLSKLKRPIQRMKSDKEFGKIATNFLQIFDHIDKINKGEDRTKHTINIDKLLLQNDALATEVLNNV